MNLKSALQETSFNLISIFPHFKKKEIIKELDKILQNDYEELSKNKLFANNFFELVSYLYTHEQLKKMDSEKENSLKVALFDEAFTNKLQRLIKDNYEYNTSISY